MILTISLVFLIIKNISGSPCNEEAFCLTFSKDSLATYCAAFLDLACPVSCGKCAAENLKYSFISAFDVNNDGKITVNESQNATQLLGINLEDALVTDIKELVLDTKTILIDLYTLADSDRNGILNINEFINGFWKFFELIGVEIKQEFKQTVGHLTEIVKVSQKSEIIVPKLSDISKLITTKMHTYPHGLITLTRFQNYTNDIDFERLITATNDLKYSINEKLLAWYLLNNMDINDDSLVCAREFIQNVLDKFEFLNVTLTPKIYENVEIFSGLLDNSINSLLRSYEYDEVGELEGKVLPELGNKKFIDHRLKIFDILRNTKQNDGSFVSKYLKSATNNIPTKKITKKSLIEATFIAADKNKDFELDLVELHEFAVVDLEKINCNIKNSNDSQKIMDLFDINKDGQLNMDEFKDFLL